jgi:hypothetical protein
MDHEKSPDLRSQENSVSYGSYLAFGPFYGDSNDSQTKPGVTGDTTPLPPEVTSTLDDGLHLLLGPEMVDIHGDTMRYLHM